MIGGTLREANYTSGSGTSALVFTYTILAGQADANGISINPECFGGLNGGTITDAAGNAATLTAASVTDNASLQGRHHGRRCASAGDIFGSASATDSGTVLRLNDRWGIRQRLTSVHDHTN